MKIAKSINVNNHFVYHSNEYKHDSGVQIETDMSLRDEVGLVMISMCSSYSSTCNPSVLRQFNWSTGSSSKLYFEQSIIYHDISPHLSKALSFKVQFTVLYLFIFIEIIVQHASKKLWER